MKIYTSYFGNLRKIPKGITPISIANYMPKGLNFSRYNLLCPPVPVMNKHKQGGSFEDFSNEYKAQVLSKLNAKDVIENLKYLSYGNDIVLLCYEKDDTTCHRSILREWLNEQGYETQEWKEDHQHGIQSNITQAG